MTKKRTDFDSPWKEIIERYLREFMAFFFPQIHQEVDWARGYHFMDTELQKIVRDAALGRRLADKLVQVWRRDGTAAGVLIHIEVQSQSETDFARRMFRYYYRLLDVVNGPVVSLAVLGDTSEEWRPHTFNSALWGCKVAFEFPIVKLRDYATDWAALEANRNLFATVVMAHLQTQRTRRDAR